MSQATGRLHRALTQNKDVKSPAYMVLSLPSTAHTVRERGRRKVCTSECQRMERNPLGGGTCCL